MSNLPEVRLQVSPYALVVLPASDDPALKHFDHVYVETLLFFPTRPVLLEWIDALLAAGRLVACR